MFSVFSDSIIASQIIQRVTNFKIIKPLHSISKEYHVVNNNVIIMVIIVSTHYMFYSLEIKEVN